MKTSCCDARESRIDQAGSLPRDDRLGHERRGPPSIRNAHGGVAEACTARQRHFPAPVRGCAPGMRATTFSWSLDLVGRSGLTSTRLRALSEGALNGETGRAHVTLIAVDAAANYSLVKKQERREYDIALARLQ